MYLFMNMQTMQDHGTVCCVDQTTED